LEWENNKLLSAGREKVGATLVNGQRETIAHALEQRELKFHPEEAVAAPSLPSRQFGTSDFIESPGRSRELLY